MATSDELCVSGIRNSGLTIYDAIPKHLSSLKISDKRLERILTSALKGLNVNLPPRSRSKAVKIKICEALGYPVPKSFEKTQPRFLGQDFDTYVQKSNNLQIWNEEISPTRRYALIFVSEHNLITHVRVLNGESIALLDKTGTLTQKYQASLKDQSGSSKLASTEDTGKLASLLSTSPLDFSLRRPTDEPKAFEIVPIAELYQQLSDLVGIRFPDAGIGQERVRGGALHELVCKRLGYPTFSDNGQLPDILDQLLEIKLQLARTVDLGLVSPDSSFPVTNVPTLDGQTISHSDLRYAVFDATTDGELVTVTRLTLVTGLDFFTVFRRFEGNVLNRKLQIPLPKKLTSPDAQGRS
jgi:hypothetical protein